MKTWLIAIGSIIVAIFAAFVSGKNNGKIAQKSKQNEKILHDIKVDKNSRDYSNSITTDKQLDELRDDIKK